MLPKKNPNKRSRHTSETRSRMVLEAADRLFSERGYHATSINDVIALSGGSKATLAAQFGDKAGLFSAYIANFAEDFSHDIARLGETSDVRTGLQAIGEFMLNFYLSHRALQVYRGVVAAGPGEPEVARRFYVDGHLRIVGALAAVLQRWRDAGALACPSPHRAADLFSHMLRHGLLEQTLIGLRQQVPAVSVRRHIRATVDAFLQGSVKLRGR